MTKRLTTIRFSIDKNGVRRAHYWGLARRWLPISIEAAQLKLATQPERYVRDGSALLGCENAIERSEAIR